MYPQFIVSQSNQFYIKEHLVIDLFTSTEWMRCSVGQRWNGESCNGKIVNLNHPYCAKFCVLGGGNCST